MVVLRILLCLFCLSGVGAPLYGQETKTAEDASRLYLEHADRMSANQLVNPGAHTLAGDVLFRHQGMQMWADSAVYYPKTSSFEAFGHVKITQGDTLSLTADELYYDGEILLAQLRHNVIVTHNDDVLRTDSLDYNRLSQMGYFFEGGSLENDSMRLVSDWGEYHVDTKEARFYDHVNVTGSSIDVVTDSLYYNTFTKWIEAHGPTRIYHEKDYIYTHWAEFNNEQETYHLYKKGVQPLLYHNAKMRGDEVLGFESFLRGDKVEVQKKGWTRVVGNMYFEDMKQRSAISGDYAQYCDTTGMGYVTGKALVKYFEEKSDTMYLHADTLRMLTYHLDTDSVYRELRAYHHVRSYRTDMQSVCDSLTFSSQSKQLHLYDNPIVWSDSRQILGEEITVFMNDSTMDSIYVDRQALMVEKIDSTMYNQVAAEQFRTYFEQGQLRKNMAEKNVYVVYYPLEKGNEINNSWYLETAKLCAWIHQRQLERLWAPGTKGTGYPVSNIPQDKRFLKTFAWFDYVRPLSPADVFEWRGKRDGTELKAQPRHKAPLQQLK